MSTPARAQDVDLPYWASISADQANMRAGASERYPIKWVYERRGLPVKVVRSYQGWRMVREPDGTEGWIFSSLLSRQRTAIVIGEDLATMHESGSESAPMRWTLEPGVVGVLGECIESWCEFSVERMAGWHRGWVAQDRLWGAGEP